MENHKHVSSYLKSKTNNPKMKNDKNKVERMRVRKKKDSRSKVEIETRK